MADSPVAIANRAISMCGQTDFITSMSEGSATAELVNLHWDSVRRKALRFAPFLFAKKREELAAAAATPPAPWAYAYQWPEDCIRPLAIDNGIVIQSIENKTPYLVENSGGSRVIYTSQENACLIYVFNQSDTTIWTEAFEDFVVMLLASAICMGLTKNVRLATELGAGAREAARWAAAAAAEDQFPGDMPEAGHIRARA